MFGINKGKYASEQIILFMATAGHECGMGNYNYVQFGASGYYRGAGALQLTYKEVISYRIMIGVLLEHRKEKMMIASKDELCVVIYRK